jgi:tetratricopeptide (TPR) repeat protein
MLKAKNNETTKDTAKKRGLFFHFLKWILIVGIIATAVSLVSKPIRKNLAEKYLQSGDIYLEQRRFQMAILEYKKSSLLYKKDLTDSRIKLASDGAAQILLLEDFFRERKLEAVLQNFDKVKNLPESEVSSVKLAKDLIEQKEYQLAIIPARHSVEINKNYRDGWLYLGIATLKCAETLEIDRYQRADYHSSARTALEKAAKIDPAYQPTIDYLAKLPKDN